MKRYSLPFFLASLVHSSAAVAVWEVDVLDVLPQFSEVGFVPGQGFRAEFFAPDGNYGISFSPDLSAGSFGQPVTVTSVNGVGSYLDSSALGRAKGFYRLEGTFQSDAYHLIAPAFALERYEVSGVTSGDLVGEVIAKGAILEYRSEADGGILYDSSGFLFQQYLIPALDTINVFSGFTDDLVQARTSFPAGGLSVEIPAGGINLPYGDATRSASVQDFLGFETDRSFLAATERVEYQSDPEASNPSFDGTKFAFPFLVKKSLDADAADLEGNWGIINLTVGGFREFDNNEEPIGPVSAFYGVYASVGTIQSTDVGSGNLNITGQWDFEALEEFGDTYFAAADGSESVTPDQLPFILSANGEITLTDEFNEPIYGAVSPSASMLVATRAFPDALDDDFSDDLGFSDQSLIVAVKRDTSPVLAGKTFRMKTLGFYVNFLTEPGFEMYRGNPQANLRFSADGTTATLFASQDYLALTIDGGELHSQDFFNVALDVQVRQDGTIVLTADDTFGFSQLVGFAQEDGDAMIFANTYEDDQGYYEVGLMILKEE